MRVLLPGTRRSDPGQSRLSEPKEASRTPDGENPGPPLGRPRAGILEAPSAERTGSKARGQPDGGDPANARMQPAARGGP
jgi:hypothetical protein